MQDSLCKVIYDGFMHNASWAPACLPELEHNSQQYDADTESYG